MASIHRKAKNGVWYISYRQGGKLKHRSLGTRNSTEARRLKREIEHKTVLEDTQPASDVLEEVRKVLINLTGRRKIDETPAALSAEIERFGGPLVADAEKVQLWAAPANLPLPTCFAEGKDTFAKINAMTNPSHRVNEIHVKKAELAVARRDRCEG